MVSIKNILFPTDFSETSKRAAEYAIYMAKFFKAHLEILHVQLDETQIVAFYLPETTLNNVNAEMFENVKKQLEEFCAGFKDELVEISYDKKIVKGIPHVAILEEACNIHADLIVIGTHGRSGFEHLLFGSNTEKVIRKAPCPVLTVSLKGLNFCQERDS